MVVDLEKVARETWIAAKRLKEGLAGDAIFAGCNDDRYQARVALYLAAATLVDDRHVLDLEPGTGLGAEPLLTSGALSYAGLFGSDRADRSARRYAERHYRGDFRESRDTRGSKVDLIVSIDDRTRRAIDAELTSFDAILERDSIVLAAAGAYSTGVTAGDGQYLSSARKEALKQRFLSVEPFHLYPPNGYLPDWRPGGGTQGRAQDYRLEPASRLAELQEQSPGKHPLPVAELAIATLHRSIVEVDPLCLHIGSGLAHLDGWLNVDLRSLPGVDIAMDVTRRFPFDGVDSIYAEHFIEHLAVDEALEFLENSWRALAPGGKIRLSTPNLEWVWLTHYRQDLSEGDAIGTGPARESCLLRLATPLPVE